MIADAWMFDLDGTLMDSEILWVEATERFVRDRGCSLSHADALFIVYGKSWRDVHRDLCERYPSLAMDLPAMTAAMHPYFLALRDTRDVLIHGSIALLRRLAATRPVCVVSGSCRADVLEGIRLMGIGRDVALALGAEDYERGKPDPTCYLTAAARVGAAPARCVAFEDSLAGVTAAKDAGMRCVALARDGRPAQDLTRADLVLRDLSGFDPADLDAALPGRDSE